MFEGFVHYFFESIHSFIPVFGINLDAFRIHGEKCR